jgi:hypothetical protein
MAHLPMIINTARRLINFKGTVALVAEFIDPDWGDKVNSGIRLTLSPSHGSMNSAKQIRSA